MQETIEGNGRFRRTLRQGVIGVVFLALATAPSMLLISPATADAQTATAAGEDDGGDTPPAIDTPPTTPAPVPTVPAPPAAPPAPPAAAPPAAAPHTQKPQRVTPRHQAAKPVTSKSTPVAVVTTTPSTPVGGIQTGKGGAVQHGPSEALLALGSGLLTFGLVGGLQARRRRVSRG